LLISVVSHIFCRIAEQLTVGISFDQSEYTVPEGDSLTLTGQLTGLLGEIQTNFSVDLLLLFDDDPLTSKL